MTDPHSAIPEHAQPQVWRRYENWRAVRYERNVAKYAGRYPGMRNRRSYRRLALVLVGFLVLVLIAGVAALFTNLWFWIPFVIGLIGTTATLTVLRIITGSVADAPVSALDEIQLAQRNSARSIGYIVLFSLMFIPYLILIFLGSAMDLVSGQNVYGIGVLLIGLVLAGACTPTILTSWWQADPDPEDFVDDAVTASDPEPSASEPVVSETKSAPTTAVATAGNLDPPAPAPW